MQARIAKVTLPFTLLAFYVVWMQSRSDRVVRLSSHVGAPAAWMSPMLAKATYLVPAKLIPRYIYCVTDQLCINGLRAPQQLAPSTKANTVRANLHFTQLMQAKAAVEVQALSGVDREQPYLSFQKKTMEVQHKWSSVQIHAAFQDGQITV